METRFFQAFLHAILEQHNRAERLRIKMTPFIPAARSGGGLAHRKWRKRRSAGHA